MRNPFDIIKSIPGRTVKIACIVSISLITIILLLPELFPGFVSNKIKTWGNQTINGEVNFSGSRLSFIKHFPSLTLTLYDFCLKGSEPYKQDTLLACKELAFGFDVLSLFKSKMIINKFLIDKAFINIQIDNAGGANYNIYKSSDTATSSGENPVALQLSEIGINKSKFMYHDRSLPLLVIATDLNYRGKADLAKGLFDLESHLVIQSLDVLYDQEPYVLDKKINASLITHINTNSLAFSFEKNDILINELPLSLKGSFNFLKNGYGIDMRMTSGHIGLKKIFSVLPPKYMKWSGITDIKGDAVVTASFVGQYIAATNTNPDLTFGLQVKDGYINHGNATHGIMNLRLAFETKVPGLNSDSLIVNLDTLSFNLNKDYVHSSHYSQGINPVYVRSYADAILDVGQLNNALGISAFEVKGKTESHIKVDGTFAITFDSLKHYTDILSLPVFDIQTKCSGGYFKMASVPYAFSDINSETRSGSTEENKGLSKLYLDITPLSFKLANNPFTLSASLSNFDNIQYNISSKGTLDLEKIYAAFAQKGLGVKGFIKTDLSLSGTQKNADAGRYDRLKNSGTFFMKDIAVSYYPYPKPVLIENGLLRFKQDKIWLENFTASYGDNQLQLNGYVENIFNHLLKASPLRGKLNLQTNSFIVDDLMSNLPATETISQKNTGATVSTGVVLLPKDLSIEVSADAKNVLYNDINIKDFKGSLLLDSGKLSLSETNFHLADAIFNMEAKYGAINTQRAFFGFDIKADSFDIKKAYREIKLFRNLASAASTAEGIVSLSYHLEGKLNNDMMPVYPSLKGGGTLTLNHVKVKGYKLFAAVSKASGKDSINNPDLKKVNIKTTIANNIITIERTKMKVFGFRPRVEGQTSFDGKLNLKFRLGLPPFGILGIPMTVTGTSAHPIVKLHKGKETDKLEETVDEEE